MRLILTALLLTGTWITLDPIPVAAEWSGINDASPRYLDDIDKVHSAQDGFAEMVLKVRAARAQKCVDSCFDDWLEWVSAPRPTSL